MHDNLPPALLCADTAHLKQMYHANHGDHAVLSWIMLPVVVNCILWQ